MIHREDSIPIDSQLVRFVQKETFWMTNSLFKELVLFINSLDVSKIATVSKQCEKDFFFYLLFSKFS